MTKQQKKSEYRHLVRADRDEIEILLKKRYQQVDIAGVLGVSPSTLCREIKRNSRSNGVYEAAYAQWRADNGRRSSKYQGMKVEALPDIKTHIVRELRNKRSPDEIAGRLRLERGYTVIGKDAIYRWLYSSWGQQYCRYLCTKRYQRKKQRKTLLREMIPNRVPLTERPTVPGLIHAQGDTFVSPKRAKTTASAAVVVLEESKLLLGVRIPNLRVRTMVRAVRSMLRHVCVDTLTLDNGIENRGHEQFGVPSFFADPYSSWQKPLVEASIGLLRRWFVPKGTDLRSVSNSQLQEYLAILNGKYRKSLGYRSAYEVARASGAIKKIPSPVSLLSVQDVALHLRI